MAALDPIQLQIGTRHELEHTGDVRIARQIAIDHLREIPDYYTRLANLERRYERGVPARLGRGFGQVPPINPAVIVQTESMARSVEALGVVFGGLFSATSLIMFALGKDRAGYMLGVAGALSTAIVGGIKVFAEPRA